MQQSLVPMKRFGCICAPQSACCRAICFGRIVGWQKKIILELIRIFICRNDNSPTMPLTMGLKERFGVDLGVFKDSTTWKALGIGIVLFSIIGYAGLSMFDIASSGYGVDRDNIRLAPDFEVETVNRTLEESDYVNDTGWFQLSEHRGKVVVLDFMAIDCANCHLVQEHLELQVDDWRDYDGDYEIIVISVGMWYSVESLGMLNDTFGDSDSSSHMPWIVATGADDSVLKSEIIHSGMNSSEVDLDDGTYCLEAQVNGSAKEVSCFDIGNGLHDNDELDVDVDGIEITILKYR